MAGPRGGKHTTVGGGQITGQVGVPPPPGAPIETAQPVSQAWVDQAARLARQSEKELPAFAPKGAGEGGAPSEAAVRAREIDAVMGGHARAKKPVAHPPARQRPSVTPPAAGAIILTDAPALPAAADYTTVAPGPLDPQQSKPILAAMGEAILAAQAAVDAGERSPDEAVDAGTIDVLGPPTNAPIDNIGVDRAVGQLIVNDVARVEASRPPAASRLAAAARDLTSHRTRNAQPAASNTDTPSRGLPRPVADPGKQITGGFGEAHEAQYFPLDGNELREVVLGLMDKLAAQIQNDLRFSIAVVYPRVAARVVVSIDCYAQEMSFEIPKRADHLKTPVDVAERSGATAQTITLENTIAEFSPDGESLVPPNVMRRELGLEIPRKQRVATPTGYALVDKVAR